MVGPTKWNCLPVSYKKKKNFWDSIYFVPTALSNMSPIMSDFLLIVLFCVFFSRF